MKKNFIWIVGAAVLIGVIALFVLQNGRNLDRSDLSPSMRESKSDETGEIRVTITPKEPSPTADTWDFLILMDTHSVDLDADLMKTAVLIDYKGTEYKPLAWDGDPPGGHHREGILKFKAIGSRPRAFLLVIYGLGGISERRFSWGAER